MAELLSADAVHRIAALARLSVDPPETDRLRADLTAVIGYMNVLQAVPATTVASDLQGANRLDEDSPGPMLPREALLEMAPVTRGPFVAIPRVIGEGA